MRKITQEEFVQRVQEVYGDEYIVLGTYAGLRKLVEIKHKDCGWEFSVSPGDFLRKKGGCPNCTVGCKLDTRLFKKRIFDIAGEEYEALDEYNNSKTKVTMKHNVCGNTFKMTPHSFLRGSKCPSCARETGGKKIRKTHEEFEQDFQTVWQDEYELLGRYELSSKKVKVRHNSDACDFHVFSSTPNNLVSKKSGCPKCANNTKSDTIVFKQQVYKLVGDEYEVLGSYINNRTSLLIKHNTCGSTYETTPKNFTGRNRRCPICAESKGERAISDFLERSQVVFEREYSFEDCKLTAPLRFDFAIFNQAGEIACLIEYDGEQHFVSKPFFGGQQEFELTQRRDKIKNEFCEAKNLRIIRIPYWEFDNIEQILEDALFL